MRFTDGYWQLLPGVSVLRPAEVDEVEIDGGEVRVYCPTAPIRRRGDTLNRPVVTVTLTAPAEGIVGVRIEHFSGRRPVRPEFELFTEPESPRSVERDAESVSLISGRLRATVATTGAWQLDFRDGDRTLTSSTRRSVGLFTDAEGHHHVAEQLSLGVGEHLYGLGERFGPFVRNGQSVDVWNADGGTSSDQAYKNVPFYLSDRGYGVFVAHPERVGFELATEAVSQAQFSVPGQALQYYVIAGPTPAEVLGRYTALTGRAPEVPDWSYGLWLSTSFTTDYDERSVTAFIDGMAERDLPLSVFHFDCFWMRRFRWCDFVWDPATFPDPPGMLRRLRERGLKVSVWINPYIAQRSELFAEGAENGYLLRTTDGDVWQWDLWQAGMGLVDFTNPAAVEWYTSKLKMLLDTGVDAFKTDFGERIPVEGVRWHDGSDPERMHNYYAQLYNRAVHDVLAEHRGRDQAVLFARSATAGGQRLPVHWGGDCESSFTAMAESLRGGLSLGLSGFGFWSHDIGGFEGTPDPTVFKRWVAFGLLSSHSRLHGSGSVRVPWAVDEEAVAITRRFTRLKLGLMPYLRQAGRQASTDGLPVMRAMVLQYPDDRSAAVVDTQYLLGADLLVAPVFDPDGWVDYYLPEGVWTHLLSGEQRQGPGWFRERYAMDSLPLFVRPGAVLPRGAVSDRPDYAHHDGLTLELRGAVDDQTVAVPVADGSAVWRIRTVDGVVTVSAHGTDRPWRVVRLAAGEVVAEATATGETTVTLDG